MNTPYPHPALLLQDWSGWKGFVGQTTRICLGGSKEFFGAAFGGGMGKGWDGGSRLDPLPGPRLGQCP